VVDVLAELIDAPAAGVELQGLPRGLPRGIPRDNVKG